MGEILVSDPRSGGPGTGKSVAFSKRVAAIECGIDVNILATVTVARNKTSVPAANTSTQLLAAGSVYQDRYGVTIINGGSTALSLGFGVAAVVGTGVTIQPGAKWSWAQNMDPSGVTVSVALMQGVINGIWAGSPTGDAYIIETVD